MPRAIAERLYPPSPYEELDHTADAGVRVHGDDAHETVGRLVLAFAALLTGGAPVPEEERLVVRAEPAERAFMAIDVLRELLFRFDRERKLPASCSVEQFDEALGAVVSVGLGSWDAGLHADGMELKAVTLHGARFERQGEGW